MFIESCCEETAECKASDDAEREGENRIRSRQEGMHDQFWGLRV